MKVYTEEQVKHAIKMARASQNLFTTPFIYDKYEILEQLTPIELPSDEEINLPIHIHEGVENIHVYVENGVIHVKRND
jgi:hypothetical protein